MEGFLKQKIGNYSEINANFEKEFATRMSEIKQKEKSFKIKLVQLKNQKNIDVDDYLSTMEKFMKEESSYYKE